MTIKRASSLFLQSFAIVIAFIAVFSGVSFAASAAVGDDGSLLDLARPLVDAVMHGNWFAAAASAVVLLVAATRAYGGKRFPWLLTDAGGATLTLAASFFGAIATAAMAGNVPSLALFYAAAGVAVAAAGGYSLIRKLGLPLLRKLAAKVPGLSLVVNLLAKVFDRDPAADAKAAGDAAVKANPAKGVDEIVGYSDDLR